MTEAEVAAATLASWSKPGPESVPSTSIGVKRKRETPRAVRSATASSASTSLVSVPPRQRNLAAGGADRDDDPLAVLLQHRREEIRIAKCRRADDDVFDPRPQ